MNKAVIFDIDGTLADKYGRCPYDWESVGDDLPKKPVIKALNAYKKAGYKIIIFTGRDGSCKKQTLAWLKKHSINFHHFDIRKAKDNRCDSIVKREMYDKIKDKYSVEAVFDDRDRVVRTWRDLGLQCFQVDYGAF